MGLKSKNKVRTEFSMASMTDIVFLLLIFFMLTASFITPSGLNVTLPTSKVSNIEMQKITVTISKELEFRVNEKTVTQSGLETELKKVLQNTNKEERLVVLHVDKDVPVEHLINVASIATEMNAKISVATKPQ